MIHDLLLVRPPRPWCEIRNQVCIQLQELFTKEAVPGVLQEDLLKYANDAETLTLDHSGMIHYMRLRLRHLKSELPQSSALHDTMWFLEDYLTTLHGIVKETESQRKSVIDTPIAVLYASPDYFANQRKPAGEQKPYPQSKQEDFDD